jgi:polyisoprenoid-binding protein YceI
MISNIRIPTFTSLAVGASLAAIALLATPSGASAQARTFGVASGSRIQFVSDAPLERITGTSSTVSGDLTVNPADLSTARGTVRVPVSSIRTGDDLRDEHLHSDSWLDAGAHPDATFEITGIDGATALTPGAVTSVTLRGRFSIHGVTRDITASAQVRYILAEGGNPELIRAQARFSVELPDFGVSVNPLVRLKVSDHITVNVTIRATAS